MTEESRVLRLPEMLARQRGSFARRAIHTVVCVALRLFFRRIEASGMERVPRAGPLIFVLNHPNGLVDPALIFCALPRRVSFLAKSTLFRLPVLGWLIRQLDALPVYRRIDKGEDVTQNKLTFAACHALLRRGRAIALFPEGISHNATELQPVKTGAARIALGAIAPDAAGQEIESLRIVPVGLFYTSKTTFRSEALLRVGEAFAVQPVATGADGEPARAAVDRLSKQIEAALRAVTLNVESDEALDEVKRAEQLFSSFYESLDAPVSLTESFNLLRRMAEGRQRQSERAPERIARLRQRIAKHEAQLRRVGIAPAYLSLPTRSKWRIARHFMLRTALLLFLSPLALAGALLHYPAYLICDLLGRRFRKHGADDIVSTVKIIAAIILMPLTWLIVAALVYLRWGWRAALIAAPATVICGYVAMRCMEELYEMRGWYKAAFVLLRRRALFLRLLLERRALRDEIAKLEESAH